MSIFISMRYIKPSQFYKIAMENIADFNLAVALLIVLRVLSNVSREARDCARGSTR